MQWKRNRIVVLVLSMFLMTWKLDQLNLPADEVSVAQNAAQAEIASTPPPVRIHFGPTPQRAFPTVDGCGKACFAKFNDWTPKVKNLLRVGRKAFSRKKVVICGLIHNSEKTVEKMFHLMHETVKDALDYRVMMFENDSRDNTSAIMQTICSKYERTICINEVGLKSAAGFGAFGKGRFDVMAGLRNRLVQQVLGGELKDWDAMIVVDMDLFDRAFSPGGYVGQDTPSKGWKADMVPTMFATDHWDVMCGNGIWSYGRYYDTLAFRNNKYNDTLNKRDKQLFVAMRDKSLEFKGESLVPVYSCFGGIAAYKIKALAETKCVYTGDDCEHVTLNQCLTRNNHGRIFINPLVTAHYDSAAPDRCEDPCH